MKYFCKVKLSKAKVNELVYANGSKDAEAIARANVAILLEDWNETYISSEIFSFFTLGQMACNFHEDIMYAQGDYYFNGRKINDDIHFITGFADAYHDAQQEQMVEDAILYEAIDEKQT